MSKPFNICVARPKKDGGVYWAKIGSAFPDQNGGFNLTFDALPVPEYSQEYGLQVRAKLFPPRDDNQQGQQQNYNNDLGLDSEVPF